MLKLINKKGATALATALGVCAYSVAPNNSAIISTPITPSEAQDIKGGIVPLLPLAVIGWAITIDTAIIGAMIGVYVASEIIKHQNQNP